MALPFPFRPDLPMLLDTGAVIGPVADPASALIGSPYVGRIFYLKRAGWEKTRFPDYISRSEADSYKRAGKAIVLNFEDASPSWCLGGYDIGKDRGNTAAAQLREIDCENAAVYMSVDFNVEPGSQNMQAVMECLQGFQDSALGKRGRAIYGFASALREAHRRGLADYYWLCGDGRRMYDENGDNQDRDIRDYVNIWQQNNEQPVFLGNTIDNNYIYTDDYGQWMPGKFEERNAMANADDVMGQIFGGDGKGWKFLGQSQVAPERDATMPEALGKVLDQLGGPDHNFGGWPQLGGLTLVDALSVVGWFFGVPGFEPVDEVKAKLALDDSKRFRA